MTGYDLATKHVFYLSYISTATEVLDSDALADILSTSQSRNEADNLTGLLIYNGLNFLQVLEGKGAAVLDTYTRIVKDARHDGVRLVSQGWHTHRAFPD